jgi:hypothetical protein
MRFGLEILADGRRRRTLEKALSRVIEENFDGRVLPFDYAGPQTELLKSAWNIGGC